MRSKEQGGEYIFIQDISWKKEKKHYTAFHVYLPMIYRAKCGARLKLSE